MTDPDSNLEVGTVLDDRYEIVGEIARGGFGMVYRARQMNMDREVAIKMVPPKFMELPDVVQRFEREARLASRLSHPNTITVHDYGQFEDYLFLVMELLEGEDLADVLARDRTVPLDRIAHIGRQVLKSLNEAHQHNIVHRDLKPENIFLTEISGEEDFVKVVDFGIAKLAMPEMEADRETSRSLTMEGNTVGTPTYMSPEQAAGGEVDSRSDLYALGVIMYEMAAGQPPFDDDDPAKLMRKHIFEDVPDFPDESLRGCWLEPIVQRAMAKEKSDRYQDAEAFIDAIDYAIEAANDERAFAPTREQASVAPSESALAEESREIVSPGESEMHTLADPGSSAYETPSDGPNFGQPSDRAEIRAPAENQATSSSTMTVIEPSPEEDVIVLDQPKETQDSELDESDAPSHPNPRAENTTPNDAESGRVQTQRGLGEVDYTADETNRSEGSEANPPADLAPEDDPETDAVSSESMADSSRESWEWSGEYDPGELELDDDARTGVEHDSRWLRGALWVLLLAAAVAAVVVFFTGVPT